MERGERAEVKGEREEVERGREWKWSGERAEERCEERQEVWRYGSGSVAMWERKCGKDEAEVWLCESEIVARRRRKCGR